MQLPFVLAKGGNCFSELNLAGRGHCQGHFYDFVANSA